MSEKKKSFQAEAIDFIHNYIKNKTKNTKWYFVEDTIHSGWHYFMKFNNWTEKQMYFSFFTYKNFKSFGFALMSDGYFGDEKFTDNPIYNYEADEGETKLSDEDKRILSERADYVISIVEGLNDTLRKDINMIEEKFFVNKIFEKQE